MWLVEMQVDQIPYAHVRCKILSSSFMALCILNQTEGQCEGEWKRPPFLPSSGAAAAEEIALVKI